MNYSNRRNKDNKYSKKNIEHMANVNSISIETIIFLIFIYIVVSVIYYQAYLKGEDLGPLYAASWPLYLFFNVLKETFKWFKDAIKKMGDDTILLKSKTIVLP